MEAAAQSRAQDGDVWIRGLCSTDKTRVVSRETVTSMRTSVGNSFSGPQCTWPQRKRTTKELEKRSGKDVVSRIQVQLQEDGGDSTVTELKSGMWQPVFTQRERLGSSEQFLPSCSKKKGGRFLGDTIYN